MSSFKPSELQPPRHVRLLQNSTQTRFQYFFASLDTRWLAGNETAVLACQSRHKLSSKMLKPPSSSPWKIELQLPTVKGDILLVSDMALFHAREGFHDADIALKRHLVKMSFRDQDQGLVIPSSLEESWGKSYGPNMPDGSREEIWYSSHEKVFERFARSNG